ncbi:MAG: response regulator [Betaproteobacteria bacterium]|nr:response regulator [Betaproteobacteria bacterium]
MSEPRVYVIDDDAAVRDSLALLLELRGLKPVAYAGAAQFLAECRPDWAGCVVLDLKMPGMDGLQLQAALAERSIALPIIFITGHGDVAHTRSALKAGAVDFIEKPIDDELLVATVQRALERAADERLRRAQAASVAERMQRLTGRERQVLGMVTEGKHNREIAAALGISPRTVEVYKSRMMEKLQVRRLPDLLKLVLGTQPPTS